MVCFVTTQGLDCSSLLAFSPLHLSRNNLTKGARKYFCFVCEIISPPWNLIRDTKPKLNIIIIVTKYANLGEKELRQYLSKKCFIYQQCTLFFSLSLKLLHLFLFSLKPPNLNLIFPASWRHTKASFKPVASPAYKYIWLYTHHNLCLVLRVSRVCN